MKKLILLASAIFFSSSSFSLVGDIEAESQQYSRVHCQNTGGKVVQLTALFDTHSGYKNGVTKPFCQYTYGKKPYQSIDIVGLETLSNSPTIAATYIKRLSIDPHLPLPTTPYANPSLNVCLLLYGAEISYNVLDGGFSDKDGMSDICVFGDGSSVSAWSLIYAAENARSKVKDAIRSKPLAIDIPKVQ